MQLAHVSDTHLGYVQYGLEDRERDFYESFQEIIDKILQEHVKLVIHSGDFFHTPRPSIQALKVAQDGLLKLKENGVQVIVILGGHDMLRRKGLPPLSLYERFGVKILRRKAPYVKLDNTIFIAGMEHIPKIYWSSPHLFEELMDLAKKAETSGCKRKVLVMHQGISPYMMFGSEFAQDQLPKNFDYYAFGHLHKRIKVVFGNGVLAYPGSTEIVELSEINEFKKNGKGFYIVDLSGDIPDVQNINIDCVRPQEVIEWDNDKIDGLVLKVDEYLKSVKDFGKKPIIHLKLYGIPIDRLAIEKMLIKRFSEKTLKIRVLSMHVQLSSINAGMISKERLDINQLLYKMLKDEELVSFIGFLLNSLKEGDLESAIRVSEKIFESRSWKRWSDAIKKVKA